MIHNDIHTWLNIKWANPFVKPVDLFKQYLNSLALACEAQLNLSENEK